MSTDRILRELSALKIVVDALLAQVVDLSPPRFGDDENSIVQAAKATRGTWRRSLIGASERTLALKNMVKGDARADARAVRAAAHALRRAISTGLETNRKIWLHACLEHRRAMVRRFVSHP